jgi:guanine deaminase
MNDPVRQLVYAERGAALDFAMVAGVVAMRDNKLTLIDESRILAEISAEMSSLEGLLAEGERSGAELRDAMDAVYRWSLAQDIAPDTYPARLR